MDGLRFTEIKGDLEENLSRIEEDVDTSREELAKCGINPFSCIPFHAFDDAFEILESIKESLTDEMSLAYAFDKNILYVRIFDGERYVFPMPFMMSEDADLKDACVKLSAYTRRELIPLIITDIPREELGFICGIFPHVDASCYEDDEDTFFINVNNECDLLSEVPSFTEGDVSLGPITEADTALYASLCGDASLNKYWGYDVREDNPEADSDYYIYVADREFNDGVAITLAVRYRNQFAGEAVIYDFDYLGSAAIAVRILPDYHGRGIGSRAVSSLIKLAKEIGLSSLRTEIINENIASIKMTSKHMNVESVGKSKTKFTLCL